MTDADIYNAFRKITVQLTPAKIKRCAGDGAMILGGSGLLLPLSSGFHWSISIFAAALVAMGLIVREWGD